MEKLIFKVFAGSDGSAGDEGVKDPVTPKIEEKADEEHKVTDEEAKLLKEVMDKKSKIKEQEAKIAELSKTVEAIQSLGGVEELSKLVQQRKDAETKAMEEKGEWDKLKAQMLEAHKQSEDGLRKQIEELTAKLGGERAKINALTVGSAFANSSYLKDKTILPSQKAQAIYGDYFDIGEDGRLTAFDKPRGAAGRTMLVDGEGNGLEFEKAIEKIINLDPDHDSLLRSASKQGSNSGSLGKIKEEPVAKKPLTGLESIMAGLQLNQIKQG